MSAAQQCVTELPPLGLYIHFPWCVRKCPYCDFNSHGLRGADLPETEYLRALLVDLDQVAARQPDRELISVFLGGGTPSLFSPNSMHTLLRMVRQSFRCAPDLEVTLEANPGTVEHGVFSAYVQAGITRLSLGAQSFSDHSLERLGRIHRAADTIGAVKQAQQAGFSSVNLDLMFGLPEQTSKEARSDLEVALALGPQHISHYNLTIEPNTIFSQQPPQLPDEDAIAQMSEESAELLAGQNFEQYEVSAYSLSGHRSQHNLNYWRFGDYAAIGAGAHSKLTESGGCVRREVRYVHPRDYIKRAESGDFVLRSELVGESSLIFEFMLNALRLRDGFSLQLFTTRTGQPAERLLPRLQRAWDLGLLQEIHENHWSATELGWRFMNDLQQIFLPDDETPC